MTVETRNHPSFLFSSFTFILSFFHSSFFLLLSSVEEPIRSILRGKGEGRAVVRIVAHARCDIEPPRIELLHGSRQRLAIPYSRGRVALITPVPEEEGGVDTEHADRVPHVGHVEGVGIGPGVVSRPSSIVVTGHPKLL